MPTVREDDARLTDPLYLRLFRLFNSFAGSSEERAYDNLTDGPSSSQPFITPTQAHFLFGEILRELRIRGSPAALFPIQGHTVSFREFLAFAQMFFTDRSVLEPAVERVFERYVSQVIRKGFLLFRKRSGSSVSCLRCSTNATKWRPAWVVVAPGCLYIWPLDRKVELSNRVAFPLDVDCQLQVGPVEGDKFMWRLDSGQKKALRKLHFSHFENIGREHWLSDMRLGIECCTRRALLESDRRRASQPTPSGADRSLSWRLALEAENLRLGKILDDERQALRDEEIVRQLATRMLEEERAKNEKISKVIEDLEQKLQVEVERRKLEHLERELAIQERDAERAERARHRRRTRELRESRELARKVEVPSDESDHNHEIEAINREAEELARVKEAEEAARLRVAEEREMFKARLMEEPERSRRLLAEWDKFRVLDEARRVKRERANCEEEEWLFKQLDDRESTATTATDIDYLITSTQSI